MARYSSWAIGLMVAFVGCSSPEERAPELPRGPRTPAEVVDALYRTACRQSMRCEPGYQTDFDLCVALVTSANLGIFDSYHALGASIEAGKVVYDDNAFTTCLSSLENEPCGESRDGWRTRLPGCATAFVGTVQDEDHCISSEECQPDSLCVMNYRTGYCAATCQKNGVGCMWNGACAAGQTCDRDLGKCVTPDPPPGRNGEACGQAYTCEPGLYCRSYPVEGQTDWQHECSPYNEEGADCDNYNPCAEGLTCSPFNSSDGTCVKPPAPLPENAVCDPNTGPPWCDDGLTCISGDSGDDARCLRIKRTGESCSRLLECGDEWSRSICDLTSHRCVIRPSSGPCVALELGGLCNPLTSFCDADTNPSKPTCVPYRKTGAPCTRHEECGGNYDNAACEIPDGATTGTCGVWPGPDCAP